MELESTSSPTNSIPVDQSVELVEGVSGTPQSDNPMMQIFYWLSENGGPVALILVLISVFALVIILLKIWQLRQISNRQVKEVELALKRWRQNEPRAAILSLAKSNQPISETHFLDC